MTEQAVMRYFFALLFLVGLVIVCFTLSDRPWLIGIVLMVISVVCGGAVWAWHFNREAERRDLPKTMSIPQRDDDDDKAPKY